MRFRPLALRLLGVAAAVWVGVLVGPGLAMAFDGASCVATYPQRNWLVLDCAPGFATERDRVSIFVRAGVDARQFWRDNLSFEEAVWFFDAGAVGRPSLIVDFRREGTGLVAEVYDDGDGDGRVGYLLIGNRLRGLEHNGKWTVRVSAPAGWWVRDGITNFNLDVAVDGAVEGMMLQMEHYGAFLRTDGRIDLTAHVRDTNGDGKPDVEWRQATPPAPVNDSWGIIRTMVMQNTRDDEPPIQNAIFWPFLGTQSPEGWIRPYGALSNPPPLQVDWRRGKITYLGEFVASRGKDGNYFIYSMKRLDPNQPIANFENPFAFYNLANATDGHVDLSVRQQLAVADDPHTGFDRSSRPIAMVQYTWDQYHRQQWDYEVSVVGFHDTETEVKLPEFSVRTIPYDQYPGWVVSKRWPAGTFVAIEGFSYWNNEHIYEWTTMNAGYDGWRYLLGWTAVKPLKYFEDIAQGMRGEYTFDLDAQPYLYFSPIDRRLHFLKAEAGVWAVRSGLRVRYENLGGPYINRWALEFNNREVEALWFAAGQLIHADDEGVSLRAVDERPARFTILPPTNNEEWKRLGTLLKASEAPFAGSDLKAMFEQFSGSADHFRRAVLRDFRPTADGFRFVLELAERPVGVPWAGGLGPGAYLVRYGSDRGYAAEPLTPARLELSPVTPLGERPAALRPAVLAVTVRNRGAEDAGGVPITLQAIGDGGSDAEIGSVAVDVPGEGSAEARFTWTPPVGGGWVLRAVGPRGVASRSAALSVADPPSPDLPTLLGVQDASGRVRVAAGALLIVAAVVATVVWLAAWRRPRSAPPIARRWGDDRA